MVADKILADPGHQDGRAREVESGRVGSTGDRPRRYRGGARWQGHGEKKRTNEATGHRGEKVGADGSRTSVLAINPPEEKAAGEIIEDEDTDETVEKIVNWLDERKLLA